MEPTRALLDFVCREFYGAEFERLQEWHVLECEPLREWIDDCADALDRGALVVAVAGSKAAYDKVIASVRGAAAGDLLHRRRGMPSLPGGLDRAVNALEDAFTMLEFEIVAIGLGLPFADHYRFMRVARSLFPNPVFTRAFDLLRMPAQIKNATPTPSDAEFMVRYFGKATVMLESAYPGVFDNLNLPGKLRDTQLWKQNIDE